MVVMIAKGKKYSIPRFSFALFSVIKKMTTQNINILSKINGLSVENIINICNMIKESAETTCILLKL
jgi:hypothetical protein